MREQVEKMLMHMRVLDAPRKKYFPKVRGKKFPSKEQIQELITEDTRVTPTFVNRFLTTNLQFDYEVLVELLAPSMKKSRLSFDRTGQFVTMLRNERTPREQAAEYIKYSNAVWTPTSKKSKDQTLVTKVEIGHVAACIDYLIRTVDVYFGAFDRILDKINSGMMELSEDDQRVLYAPYEKYFGNIQTIDDEIGLDAGRVREDNVRDAGLILISETTNTSLPDIVKHGFGGYDQYEKLFQYLFTRNTNLYGTNCYRDEWCVIPMNPYNEFMEWIKSDSLTYDTTVHHRIDGLVGTFTYESIMNRGLERRLNSIDSKYLREKLIANGITFEDDSETPQNIVRNLYRKKLMFYVMAQMVRYERRIRMTHPKPTSGTPIYLKHLDALSQSERAIATICLMKTGKLQSMNRLDKLSYYVQHPDEYAKARKLYFDVSRFPFSEGRSIEKMISKPTVMSLDEWFDKNMMDTLIPNMNVMVGGDNDVLFYRLINPFFLLREIGLFELHLLPYRVIYGRVSDFFGISDLRKDEWEILVHAYRRLCTWSSDTRYVFHLPYFIRSYYGDRRNSEALDIINQIDPRDNVYNDLTADFLTINYNWTKHLCLLSNLLDTYRPDIFQTIALFDVDHVGRMANMIRNDVNTFKVSEKPLWKELWSDCFAKTNLPRSHFFMQWFIRDSFNHICIRKVEDVATNLNETEVHSKVQELERILYRNSDFICLFHRIEKDAIKELTDQEQAELSDQGWYAEK